MVVQVLVVPPPSGVEVTSMVSPTVPVPEMRTGLWLGSWLTLLGGVMVGDAEAVESMLISRAGLGSLVLLLLSVSVLVML